MRAAARTETPTLRIAEWFRLPEVNPLASAQYV